MNKTTRVRQPFIRRGAETDDIFLEDLRGSVWNSVRDFNLTWKTLAEKSGIKPATIARFAYGETRRPVFHTIFKIAEAIGIRIKM